MIVVSITFFVATVAAIYALYKRRKIIVSLQKHFVTPPEHGFLAHLPVFYNRDLPEIFKTLLTFIDEYGKNILLKGPLYLSTAITSDPADVEILLANTNSKSTKKSIEYEFLKPWLGTGLLTSDGEKWFQRRKILTPSFHFSILEKFVDVMNRQSNIFVKKLQPRVGAGSFDVNPYVTLFALDVICEASMGITINAQSEPSSEYVLSVQEVFKFSQRIPGIFILTQDGRRHWRLKRKLHKFTTNIIANRRAKLESDACEKEKKLNFMDMLLHTRVDGKPLSDEDIREEVDTFMFEGHDTTTSGIAFTLYQLAQHQDIQEKVFEEVRDIYEDKSETPITHHKLGEMKYLEMVIKETLRIMPSVPIIGRSITEDIKIGDKVLPSGTNLIILIYAMHNDPDNFPDPEKFDPERFNSNNPSTRHPFSYIPFSAGARNCIGQRFAMLELKTIISKVLMNYRILPGEKGDDLLLTAALILKSQTGIPIRLEKR